MLLAQSSPRPLQAKQKMKSRGEIIGFIGHNSSAMGKTDP
jgi:hypothetical protein